MQPDDDFKKLIAFQETLITLLSGDTPVQDLKHCLIANPDFEQFKDYVEGFDPEMLEVASALVKKWGRKQPDPQAVADRDSQD